METEDPRAALDDADVAVRAAACRDLMRYGTWDDLPRLVDKGWNDRSMPVRLYAAAAAADIVGRQRGAWGQDALDEAGRAEVVRWAFAGDPGTNPSMLMLLGAVESDATLVRLARIVRDPRSDVRLGVVTAVRRMVLSAASDRELVAGHVGVWLADDRVPDDTRAELVKIVGEAGLATNRDAIRGLRGRGDVLAELVDVALDRLDARQRPHGWAGAYVSDGLDVFEVARVPRSDDVAVCTGEAFVGPRGAAALAVAGGRATLGDRSAHLVWATPLGAFAPVPALQVDGRTWWRVADDDAADFLDERWRLLATFPGDARAALRAWVDRVVTGANAARARPIAAWLAGDLDGALADLDAQLERKRPRLELSWWRARVLADLGRTGDARADLATFLDKARRDDPLRDDAEALRAALG